MNQDEGFLQAIVDDPDDDAVRLIYADWLEDHGDADRAEFIRVQIELARMGDDDRRPELELRQGQLLAAHENEWLGTLKQQGVAGWFARGFLDSLHLEAGFLLEEADRRLKNVPIRRLSLGGDIDGREKELVQCPFLARLRGLSLDNDGIGTPALLASPHLNRLQSLELDSLSDFSLDSRFAGVFRSESQLSGLTELRVSRASVSLQAIEGIASPHRRASLEWLEIALCKISDVHVDVLADQGAWSRLTGLDLAGNDIGPGGIRALGRLAHPGTLSDLTLGSNTFGNAGLELLMRSPNLSSLKQLKLWGNRLAGSAARAIAGCPHLSNLERLDLGTNRIGDDGAAALAGSPYLPHLGNLNLHGNEIGDAGASALGSSSHLGALRWLNLSANGLRVGGVKGLVSAGKLAELRSLDLSQNPLGDPGLQVLARSPHVAGIRQLKLHKCRIGAAGIKDLTTFDNLQHLQLLDLSGNDIDNEAALILLRSPLCSRLVRLDLNDTLITPPIVPALAELQSSSPRLRELIQTRTTFPEYIRDALKNDLGHRVVI